MAAIGRTPPELRPFWWNTASALAALAALFTTGGSAAVPLLAIGLLAVYVTPARLEEQPMVVWSARLVLFALVAILSAGAQVSGADVILDSRITYLFGQLCAAELVLHAWRRPGGRRRRFIPLLLSSLALVSACNTFETAYIRFIGPFYVLVVALGLGGYFIPKVAPRAEWIALALRWTSLLVAFAIGGAVHYSFWTYRSELVEWSERLLSPRHATATAGMAANPQLGSSFDMELSPARVLRVEGPLNGNHLRASTFEHYRAGGWGPVLDPESFETVSRSELRADAAGERARVLRYADDFHLIYAPLTCAGVGAAPGVTLEWAPRQGPALRAQGPPLIPLSYYVVAAKAEGEQGPLAPVLTPEQRQRCLAVAREIDPKVHELAQKIAGRLADPRAKIEAVVDYLISHHTYSLKVRLGAGDPVSSFLLERKPAFCQYFASAAAILLRCVGVPSRYAHGYLAHEPDGRGGLVVRGRDAHAWTECWIDGKGWVTVDATPGDGRPDQLYAGVPFWTPALERLQDLFFAVVTFFSDMRSRLKAPQLGLVLGAAALVTMGLAARRRRRSALASAGPTYSAPAAELGAMARQFEAALRRWGTPCPDHRTWQEHLADLAADGERAPPDLPLAAAETFAREYAAARFGRAIDPASLRALWARLLEVEGHSPGQAGRTT